MESVPGPTGADQRDAGGLKRVPLGPNRLEMGCVFVPFM